MSTIEAEDLVGETHFNDQYFDGMSAWADTQYKSKYSWKDDEGNAVEEWPETAERTVRHVLAALGYSTSDKEYKDLVRIVTQRKFIPGGRYLASAGRDIHQVNNCTLYRCEDSREGWADLVRKCILALSSGAGVGVVYSDVRPSGALIKGTGGVATGPLSPAQMVNEVARHVMQGGHRRSAIWGGLHWNHPDIMDWITIKDWSEAQKKAKEEDYFAPAPLDMTNISVILDDEFFEAIRNASHPKNDLARNVYWKTVEHMLAHGEPGFSIDVGVNAGENLRNACTEITSADDSDICNLGSINLARIESVEEMMEVTRLATLFLLAGTVYSNVPHEEIAVTRQKNRRLGLGLMGVHEWLIMHGYGYKVTDELRQYLEAYSQSTKYAARYADHHGISRPLKTRAIAPNGTIGIIGETTTSAEPLFCAAYKRRFLDGHKVKFQYVVDPVAVNLHEKGIDPDDVETAYSLAIMDPEKRIRFQADLQEYVDHGISSTVNLPAPITDEADVQEFGMMLLGYLPRLRGMTVYPDGARSGQPLTACTFYEAKDQVGVTFDETSANAACASGVCGA